LTNLCWAGQYLEWSASYIEIPWRRDIQRFSQSLHQRRGTWETCFWVFGEGTQNDHGQHRGNARIDEHGRNWHRIDTLGENGCCGLSLKGQHACKDFIEDNPQRIDVATLIPRRAHRLLRRDVHRCTQPRTTGEVARTPHQFGNPEVAENRLTHRIPC